MHTHPLAEYMRHIETDDWDAVAALMLSSAEKLVRCGADFLICPDNTVHRAFDKVVKSSPLPWLHIAEEVAARAAILNYRCLGVVGTRYLMEGPVYPARLAVLGIDYRIPAAPDRRRINEIILNELVNGQFTGESRTYFGRVIDELRDEGCDAVVLGCTEIPLLVAQQDSPLPILDSTRLLARAALRRASED